MMCGVRPDGSWYNIIDLCYVPSLQKVITIDVAAFSAEDVERIFLATKICKDNDCIDLFAEGTPLEVVDLLVSCDLIEKKSLWKKCTKTLWQIVGMAR